MELFSHFSGYGLAAVSFLFVLTIVVFFHELGHFQVARWCNVDIDVFSIGFGPEIFGWNDRRGTRWKVSWIPLGGYVKFAGDDSAASTPDHSQLEALSEEQRRSIFYFKPLWQRAAVVAAGPIANFILAVVIFALIFSVVGRVDTSARVDSVSPDSAAAEAGFQPGDLVLEIDGGAISNFADMQRIVSASADKRLEVLVDRGGARVTLQVTPRLKEITDRFGNKHRIGLLGISRKMGKEETKLKKAGPVEAVWLGGREVYFVISSTFSYLGRVITGREKADQLGGPLRIAQISGQMASISFAAVVNLAAVLSVSIGLINLFPIPMLDGGHLLFYAFEAVRGKPLSEQIQEYGYRLGLALVLLLMIFATWNDLVNFNMF
ncbi:MAG: RIP metalloprotease RseP [Hyphomicrobiales bacterium]|nr:MAG: RIP metalloprotease RseP [Hyphomicrobiales bacterium]